MTRQSLFLITATELGEASLFLETGVHRATRNLLLTRRHTKLSHCRLCAPDYPLRLGDVWEVSSGAAFWPS